MIKKNAKKTQKNTPIAKIVFFYIKIKILYVLLGNLLYRDAKTEDISIDLNGYLSHFV